MVYDLYFFLSECLKVFRFFILLKFFENQNQADRIIHRAVMRFSVNSDFERLKI